MSETHLHKGRQTVKLGLIKVVHDLFPEETLKTSYSILEGVFCNLYGSILSTREVKQIERKLREWVEKDSSIVLLRKEGGYYHYQVGDTIVKAVYPAFTDTFLVEPFTILPFSYGFIVDFGDIDKGSDRPLIPPVQLSAAFEKNQRWMDNINIEQVQDVNDYIRSGRTMKLVSIAEALHEKEISIIADAILQHRRALRLLLVSGPSSSGKTSFTQRLSTQLEVNGLKPIALSLDHYFVDREHTPRDADGKYDFDSMEALDLPLLTQQIAQLIAGERVSVPQFDFITGQRMAEYKPMQVGPSEILIIEGIHALNPELVTSINRNLIYKIYISALGGLNIDLMSRVPTSEIRLLRRLVRDDKYRGVTPENTIHQWDSVRRGEYQNIFKFQEEADVMFNSSMIYEMNALRPFAETALQKIPADSPYYDTRERLLNLLSFFEPLDVSKVPFNSILREFIGGSIYYD
ncbi:uridine kinase family protein [Trichococcus collinsii]|uniref:Uridine kinase n=1 Tax=Trichococcus collinsii TaxID=157076 RepID=A0AB38A0J6_9LACT|nr:nucleoside kinase [Trichococcus collinsii]CZQ88800.1 phosphoribulokinase/uridine kinase [Trichococcus collinsii]SEA46887.1 uridine kinase [Trichococcus collinsii]